MFVCNRARNGFNRRPGRFDALYPENTLDGLLPLSRYDAALALTTNRRQYLNAQSPVTPNRSPSGTPSITIPTHSISPIPESPRTPPVTPYRTPQTLGYRSPSWIPSILTSTHSINPIPESPRAR